MPMLKKTKSGTLRTFFTEMMPDHSPMNVSFTLLYIESFLRMNQMMPPAAMPQMIVTHHPAVVNCPKSSSIRVPVREKKRWKTGNCHRNVKSVRARMSTVSMARSVTTVPSDFGNDTPSQRRSTPQRANSPIRGMSRLAA